jgi:hypothetical protein
MGVTRVARYADGRSVFVSYYGTVASCIEFAVIRACCGSLFSYPFLRSCRTPYPTVVLVFYGLRYRSSRARKDSVAFLSLVLTQGSRVDCTRTTDRFVIKRQSLATWYHHLVC